MYNVASNVRKGKIALLNEDIYNVALCGTSLFSCSFQAKEIFSKMYPDSEFLPRAPDPEEIILEGEECAPGPVFEGDSGRAEDIENTTELVDEEG